MVSDEDKKWASQFTADCVHDGGHGYNSCKLCNIRKALREEENHG